MTARRTALVTGAGGFLGRYLVEQLVARGDRVLAFSRRRYADLEAIGAVSIQGDVRDAASVEAACREVDVVFHTAALAGVWGPWKDYYEINTLGTQHVVAACQQARVPKLIYTSSPSVTFAAEDQNGIDESAPYSHRWLAHYPHTKALAERHVLESNGKQGLATCALRPHLIWGPRDAHLIPRLLDRARRGRLRRVGDGTNLIDTIYVENAAVAHVQAADALSENSPVAGRAYFLSQGEPVNCWQWINELLTLAGLPPVRKAISFRAAWNLGAALEAAYTTLRFPGEPPMTRFVAAQLAKSHFFNITRAKKDFGYSPAISIEEGMRRLGNLQA